MDNFNLQSYIASGKLHANSTILTEAKKQGYDDREDESLGARKGAEKGKKQSMKDRRDDSYGKFGKRDAEKKGKNKINKESLSETIAEAKSKIGEGSYPFDQCLSDNEGKYGKKGAAKVCGFIKAQYGEGIVNEGFLDFLKKKKEEAPVRKEDPNPIIGVDYDGNYIRKDGTMAEGQINEKQDSKKGNESEQKRMEGAIKDDRDHIKDLKKDIEDNERKLARLKKDYKKDVIKEEEKDVEEGYGKPMYDEDDTDATNEEMSTKMKVSDLKKKIKEDILAELALNEADEVDVDIDVEDEVEVEAGADDIEIERKGVKARVEVGLSPEEEIIQDSLKAAMDSANALGNDKLADQIGNTITFFTREYVVGDRS